MSDASTVTCSASARPIRQRESVCDPILSYFPKNIGCLLTDSQTFNKTHSFPTVIMFTANPASASQCLLTALLAVTVCVVIKNTPTLCLMVESLRTSNHSGKRNVVHRHRMFRWSVLGYRVIMYARIIHILARHLE